MWFRSASSGSPSTHRESAASGARKLGDLILRDAHAAPGVVLFGVRITEDEITQFARDEDMQLLVVEQIWTQYMWITCRKRPAGWTASLPGRPVPRASVIRRVSNCLLY